MSTSNCRRAGGRTGRSSRQGGWAPARPTMRPQLRAGGRPGTIDSSIYASPDQGTHATVADGSPAEDHGKRAFDHETGTFHLPPDAHVGQRGRRPAVRSHRPFGLRGREPGRKCAHHPRRCPWDDSFCDSGSDGLAFRLCNERHGIGVSLTDSQRIGRCIEFGVGLGVGVDVGNRDAVRIRFRFGIRERLGLSDDGLGHRIGIRQGPGRAAQRACQQEVREQVDNGLLRFGLCRVHRSPVRWRGAHHEVRGDGIPWRHNGICRSIRQRNHHGRGPEE